MMRATDAPWHGRAAMVTLYELLGDDRILRLVDRFYAVMDSDPSLKLLRDLHPPDLTRPRERLYLFLVGWTGGPQTYTERFGHPMLRARHLPFPIGDDAAIQWMTCMSQALEETIDDVEARTAFEKALARMALHMRNREDPPAS
ncbi:MAG: group II truncated hemoglobin [Myxococcota bacterium]